MTKEFKGYLHKFSIWTSARASQRGFTTSKNIWEAIEKTELENFITTYQNYNIDKFDTFHVRNCNKIIQHLIYKKVSNVTYGRAAKILNVYLKTAFIIPQLGKGEFCKIIHPPIDRILLKRINTQFKTEKLDLKIENISWTKFTEKDYFQVIKKLRLLKYEYFWEIEKYWIPSE